MTPRTAPPSLFCRRCGSLGVAQRPRLPGGERAPFQHHVAGMGSGCARVQTGRIRDCFLGSSAVRLADEIARRITAETLHAPIHATYDVSEVKESPSSPACSRHTRSRSKQERWRTRELSRKRAASERRPSSSPLQRVVTARATRSLCSRPRHCQRRRSRQDYRDNSWPRGCACPSM